MYSMANVNVSTGNKAWLWAFKVTVEYHPANIPAGDAAAPTERADGIFHQ